MQGKNAFSMSHLSPADGTGDREAHPKHWYVAFTHTNGERSASTALRKAGFATYIPTRTELRQWSDRKKRVEVVLVPRVVFVKALPEDIPALVRMAAVSSLLKPPGSSTPARIPDQEMERFIFMVGNADTAVEITPPAIVRGERVVITRGFLRGLEGMADEDSEGMRRITIRLDSLCCASVNVPTTDIAPAENHHI